MTEQIQEAQLRFDEKDKISREEKFQLENVNQELQNKSEREKALFEGKV